MSYGRRFPLVVVAAACLLAAGCTSAKTSAPVDASSAAPLPSATSATPSPTLPTPSVTDSPTPTPTPTLAGTSATPSPTASATALPAEALAALAKKAPATMSATYRLIAGDGGTATVRIDVVPAGYRVSVTRSSRTATLIVRRDGDSTSCSTGKCFTVAKGGDGVPAAFDPQVQHAITDYLAVFADAPDELTVTASTRAATGTCFAVKPSGTGPTPVVAGTYCLDDAGHVTAVDYPSGMLTLVSVNADPTPAILTPPASPAPIVTATTTHEPTD